jgi:rSAM/selenodomain-associated transferase 1
MRAESQCGRRVRCEVAVLARAPVPGQAKTRLVPALGAAGAARLQARLIEVTVAKALALEQARVTLWLAGDPATLPAPVRGVAVQAQVGADLGARMDYAARAALARAARVLVIGTDCPALTAAHLRAARDALADFDVVLQPADDGGYVLIGMRAPQPSLFTGIGWGSPSVFAATLRRIADAGLRAAVLPALPDLDTPDDLARARAAGWL